MGIFTRFKDIVTANLSSMLDRAEDPEKMIRLMIQEMEETLIELKASCAGLMAERKKSGREFEESEGRAELWAERAELAVAKGREDLAREALVEKRRWVERTEHLAAEGARLEGLVEQAQDDMGSLEQKLASAREKQRVLVQRHIRADTRKRAHNDILRSDSVRAWERFERFEARIERMEAEADLVMPRPTGSLEDEFSRLEGEPDIEAELAAIKQKAAKSDAKPEPKAKK